MSNPTPNHSSTPAPRRRWLAPALIAATGTIVLVTGLALSPFAAAARAGFFGHGHGHGPEAMHERVTFAADWILKRIDANDEQKAEIQTILDAAVTDLAGLHGDRAALHEQVVDQLTAPQIDRTELEQLRADQLARLDAATLRITQVIADVGDVLSAEQRLKLAELAEGFHGGRRGRHGWH